MAGCRSFVAIAVVVQAANIKARRLMDFSTGLVVIRIPFLMLSWFDDLVVHVLGTTCSRLDLTEKIGVPMVKANCVMVDEKCVVGLLNAMKNGLKPIRHWQNHRAKLWGSST